MRVETHINLKNGQAVILSGIPNEFNDSFFHQIEQKRTDNGNIVLYGSNGEVPVNARDIHSIEFVILD